MKKLLITSILLAFATFTFAQTQNATTENGKKVILYPNNTWKYSESKNDSISDKKDSSNVETTNYEILRAVDKMTGKTYYSLSRTLFFVKSDKKLIINVGIRDEQFRGLLVRFENIGNCNENNKLIFLFEDDTKLTLDSWNDFNCKGVAYFDLNGTSLPKLQKKIKSIMFQNGRTYDSITIDVPESEQDYFIQVKNLLDKKIFVPAHMDDGKVIKD